MSKRDGIKGVWKKWEIRVGGEEYFYFLGGL